MADWLRFYGPPLLAWALLFSRLMHAYWRPPDQARRLLWWVLLGLAVSLTVLTPAGYAAVAQVTGVPNLARLLGHAGMLLASWSGQALLRLLHTTPSSPAASTPWLRRQVWGLLAALALLSLLFALADTPIDDVRFAGRYAATPWVLEYWLVYLACLAPAYVNMVRFAARYARLTSDWILRLGLRLLAAGAICGLAYHIHKAFLFAAHRLPLPYLPPGPSQFLDAMLPLFGHVLVLVGATLPTWGPRLSSPVSWLRRYRAYQALRPLWLDLYRQDPHIALIPPLPALVDLLSPRDLSLRLYRRVIEIRDGRMSLHPHLDPTVEATARRQATEAGVSGQALDAVVEAAMLAAAIQAKAQGARPTSTTSPEAVPGGLDLESDIAFLSDVARAYRRQARRRSRSPGRQHVTG
ncbi:MAB_1171c family putative transporter [Nonomuraea sp. NPDC046802]|uniref:MAB_1171c family putative transporter n=1 Tax=Nonomuraea sp. NPDC046802 TaxID=3154919 RepID=UPI0033FB10BE